MQFVVNLNFKTFSKGKNSVKIVFEQTSASTKAYKDYDFLLKQAANGLLHFNVSNFGAVYKQFVQRNP